jgi:hypothetical protein
MNPADIAHHDVRTMSHAAMVAAWRADRAAPVSLRIIDYARYDGVWWRRAGGAWESIPDGPFALSLSAGRDRLYALTGGLDEKPASGRDPWSAARSRIRMGGRCPHPLGVAA